MAGLLPSGQSSHLSLGLSGMCTMREELERGAREATVRGRPISHSKSPSGSPCLACNLFCSLRHPRKASSFWPGACGRKWDFSRICLLLDPHRSYKRVGIVYYENNARAFAVLILFLGIKSLMCVSVMESVFLL